MTIAEEVARIQERAQELERENADLRAQLAVLEEDQLLTIEEAAQLLRTTTGTIYQWVHAKKIPFQKVGRGLRFSRKSLKEWRTQGE